VGGGHNDAGADAKICVFAHLCQNSNVNNCEKFSDSLFAVFSVTVINDTLEYGCSYHMMCIYMVSNCCLFLYLNIAGI